MKIGRKRQQPSEPQPQSDQPQSEGSEQAPPVQAPPVPAARVQPAMLPSSPLAPFTPAVLAFVPEPVPEPKSDEPVEPDLNPMAPMAPVAVGTQGKCCGDTDGGGGGGQTPWLSDIDAARFNLFNAAQITSNETITLRANNGISLVSTGGGGISLQNPVGTIQLNGSQVRLNSELMRFDGALGINQFPSGASVLRIIDLPTSAAGLASGDVWNNAGVLNIVP